MLRIGILGAADIAFTKFIPALELVKEATIVGIASNSSDKLSRFVEKYGVEVFSSYDELIESPVVDCVYIPLPPAFHYKWAKKALLAGKHVFLEKPSTTSFKDTEELVVLAREKNKVIQENYMFVYHNQLQAIRDILDGPELGKIRLFRSSFGFPRRQGDDFRYKKELGGGTMFDNAGYTVKLATYLLGPSIKLLSSHLYREEDGLDIFGSAEFVNDEGVSMQVSFGMDCKYQCSLEAWGSTGRLTTDRIYTAPDNFVPVARIELGNEVKEISLPSDNHFVKSIEIFIEATKNDELRSKLAKDMLVQSRMVEEIIEWEK